MVSRRSLVAVSPLLLGLTMQSIASAQEPVVRVSVSSQGAQGDGGSNDITATSVSVDGRYVAFGSGADNLVAGDTNGFNDVFVRDLETGTTVRVSIRPDGAEANEHCENPSLSQDGRFVAFDSLSDNLVSGDTNLAEDVFVHDRDPDGNGIFDEGNGTLERDSVDSNGQQGNNGGLNPSLSADGRFVAFASASTNLVSGDSNGHWDVFVHDRTSGITSIVSVASDGTQGDDDSLFPLQISGNGGSVAFQSLARNLAGSETFSTWDVFAHDLSDGLTERIDVDSSGNRANDAASNPSISSDGRYVAFDSQASNLVMNDSNGSPDVFVRDRQAGTTICASVDRNGNPGTAALLSSISADATHVSFTAVSSEMVPIDLNGTPDHFVRDLTQATTVCASVDCTGLPAAGGSGRYDRSALSSDGRIATFVSLQYDLVDDDTNDIEDVFANDLSNPGLQASWTSYGAGWPGTRGVPTFTSDVDPQFGATVTLTASNSWGVWTAGFLFVGLGPADVSTNLGGTLLVNFLLLQTVVVPPAGWSASFTVPYDTALCGAQADFQMVEVDPGASRNFSFTPGLELVFGR